MHQTIIAHFKRKVPCFFPKSQADKVSDLTVFNIGGNKARLIAAIHYNTHRIYIRHILTHKEYDRGSWRK